jgi:hypothetical protein
MAQDLGLAAGQNRHRLAAQVCGWKPIRAACFSTKKPCVA